MVLLLLVGCSARQPTTSGLTESSGVASKRAVAPGSVVTLKNGLTLTVPPGWAATLTVGAVANDPLNVDEYLVLDNFAATSGPKSFMAFSSNSTSLPVSALDRFGRDQFSAFGEATEAVLFIGRAGTVYEPKRLMAVETSVPGSALGILFFAGDPGDPWSALREDAEVFKISGLRVR
jgi:hypothetical protein